MYHKIITEELVASVNKLSVVASCSDIVVLICFVRATLSACMIESCQSKVDR